MKKINLKTKIIIGVVIALMVIWGIDKFFDVFTLQNPIVLKFQSPIIKRYQNIKKLEKSKDKPKNNQILTPTPQARTEKEIIMAQKHGKVLWKIYGLESTWGRNDSCRLNNQGWAGFGVMNARQVVCYESFEKAAERAEYWLGNIMTKFNLDIQKSLCYYNTGKELVNCMYYQNYLSL